MWIVVCGGGGLIVISIHKYDVYAQDEEEWWLMRGLWRGGGLNLLSFSVNRESRCGFYAHTPFVRTPVKTSPSNPYTGSDSYSVHKWQMIHYSHRADMNVLIFIWLSYVTRYIAVYTLCFMILKIIIGILVNNDGKSRFFWSFYENYQTVIIYDLFFNIVLMGFW